MHHVSVDPSAFDFVGIITLGPIKKNCSAQSCLANFDWIIQVIVHASAQIAGKTDV
jgi:hypothetical protein